MKLSLGYSGPEVGTFLIFCAYWPSYNILVDIIFFRETEKFLDSDSSFRSHHLRHSSICQSRNILLSFTCKSLKFPLNFQVHPEIDLHSSLQFYLIFNKKWSFLDSSCRGARRLSSWENLVYPSHHYFGPHGFCSSPRASAASSVCTASCSKYGICDHHSLPWGPSHQCIHLHHDIAHHLSVAMKRTQLLSDLIKGPIHNTELMLDTVNWAKNLWLVRHMH